MPPDQLPELGRYVAIQNQLLARLDGGTLPTASAALQTLGNQFNTYQCRAAKSMGIAVNPQFGELDYSQVSVVPAANKLAAAAAQRVTQPQCVPDGEPAADARLAEAAGSRPLTDQAADGLPPRPRQAAAAGAPGHRAHGPGRAAQLAGLADPGRRRAGAGPGG